MDRVYCEHCIFWLDERIGGDDPEFDDRRMSGTCHRYAPRAFLDSMGNDETAQKSFPSTWESDFCGDGIEKDD